MQIENPYIQYMYSYPHKTAYGPLDNIDLKAFFTHLTGGKNSLYFHIPFCQFKCGYCNLFSLAGQGEQMMRDYVDAMERQAEQIKNALPLETEFEDLTIGGGTPLILPEYLLERIFQIAKDYFGFRGEGHSVVVETSPNQTTRDKLSILKQNGVTRVSIGVQSFQQKELEALCRYHTVDSAKKALHMLQEMDFSCVNMDLIYGIPGQTKESFMDSLKQAFCYQPEELFIYPLYVKQGTGLYGQKVQQSNEALAMYQCGREFLKQQGYKPYSMRRFVKGEKMVSGKMPFSGKIQYSSEILSVCGFGNTLSIGCGGRSYLGNLHFCTPYAVKQENCMAIVKAYIEKKNHLQVGYGYLLDLEEEKRRYVIKHILFGTGISREDYRRHFHGDVEQDFCELQEWVLDGYACMNEKYIALTEEGIALSDYLGPQLISSEVREKMKRWGEIDEER